MDWNGLLNTHLRQTALLENALYSNFLIFLSTKESSLFCGTVICTDGDSKGEREGEISNDFWALDD